MKKALLFLQFYIVVLVINWQSFTATLASVQAQWSDMGWIAQGYQLAQTRGHYWWYSPWINVDQRYFRPLASEVHYVQEWLSLQGLFPVITALSCLWLTAIYCLCGQVVYEITKDRRISAATAMGTALLRCGPDWAAGWFLADNWGNVTFSLLAIIFTLRYTETPSSRTLAIIWASVVTSWLFKEQGLILAPCLMVLVAMSRQTQHAKAALLHLAVMVCASLFYYRYACAAIGHEGSKVPILTALHGSLQRLQSEPFSDFIFITDSWVYSLGQLVILLLPAALFWSARKEAPSFVALFICTRLAFLPCESHGVAGSPIRFLLMWMWWSPMIATAAHFALAYLKTSSPKSPSPAHQPAPAAAVTPAQ